MRATCWQLAIWRYVVNTKLGLHKLAQCGSGRNCEDLIQLCQDWYLAACLVTELLRQLPNWCPMQRSVLRTVMAMDMGVNCTATRLIGLTNHFHDPTELSRQRPAVSCHSSQRKVNVIISQLHALTHANLRNSLSRLCTTWFFQNRYNMQRLDCEGRQDRWALSCHLACTT